jgi:hypothetical protein
MNESNFPKKYFLEINAMENNLDKSKITLGG